jgi:hypothetical protein
MGLLWRKNLWGVLEPGLLLDNAKLSLPLSLSIDSITMASDYTRKPGTLLRAIK